jgi:nitronate monooxygenase
MALRTALTDVLGLQHPILLAPMAGVSGGALAAAVSHAGDCRRGRRLDPRHTFRKCYRARAQLPKLTRYSLGATCARAKRRS